MRYFTYAIIVVVGLAVIAGFFVVGSPTEQRQRDQDKQRVNDLAMTQSYIVEYWRSKGALPEDIEALNDDIRNIRVQSDPETKASYEYFTTGSLCTRILRMS